MIEETAVARTYEPHGYTDPAAQLRDYQSVKRYSATHPDAGRTAVGSALELPPSRVRGWLNGTKPDAVRGVEIARENGWLNLDKDSEPAAAFAECVTGVFACGSIDRRWTVAYAPTSSRTRRRLWWRLSMLGVAARSRHTESSDRPTELVPRYDGSVFARCLAAAGAPQGTKNAETTPALPSWLLALPRETRRRCVELYVRERGTQYEDKETVVLRSRNRPAAYRKSLAALCRSVTDEEVTVGANVVLASAAVRDLIPAGDGSAILSEPPDLTVSDSTFFGGVSESGGSARGY